MPFTPRPDRVPTEIQEVRIFLGMQRVVDDEGIAGIEKGARFRVQINDQDGRVIRDKQVGGDLIAQISAEDRNWLIDFMDRMWAEADDRLLP